MIALSFVHPSLALVGVVAATLPIVIHLINRRRYRRVSWAAMGFLLAANRRSAHRIRIEQMLLLLMRCALLALVGIAAARPIVTGKSFVPLAESRAHHVLIIDNSASMQAVDSPDDAGTRAARAESVAGATSAAGPTVRFHRAVEAADGLITSFAATEPVSIFTAAAPAEPVVGFANYDRRQVRDALRQIEATDRGTDLGGALRLAADLLAAWPRESRAVYVLSDLQRSAWSAGGATAANARRLVNELGAKLVFVRIGTDAIDNVAITRVTAEASLAGRELPLRLSSEVFNGSRTAVRGLTLQIIRDEQIVRSVPVDVLAPGERATVTFSLAIDAAGTHAVHVRLAGEASTDRSSAVAASPHRDALPLDDARFLSTEVVASVPVLLVDGRPGTTDLGPGGGKWSGHAGYLATAMAPTAQPGQATLLAPRIIGESELGGEPLSSYAMIALCNVARLDDAVWERLAQFVTAGGGLAIFAGDLVNREHYNRLGYRDGTGVLPGRLGAPVGDTSDPHSHVRFSPEPSTHPLMADFAGAGDTGLFLARILRYLPIEPDPASASVALRYQDGQPAIVTRTLGRGRVCYVGTSANMEWNNLPAKGDFVGLVMSLAAFLSPQRGDHRNVLVGEPLHEPLHAAVVGDAAQLRVSVPPPRSAGAALGQDSSQLSAAIRTVPDGDGVALRFDETKRAGIYTVTLGASQAPPGGDDRSRGARRVFAVNVDPRESELATLDDDTLREQVGAPLSILSETDLGSGRLPTRSPSEFATLAIGALLALVLVEMWLAARFGVRQ